MKIRSINDYLKFLCDIIDFANLFEKLGLSLNTLKYKVMNFTRFLNPIIFSYLIRDSFIVCRIEFIMDLGFKFTRSLDLDHP